MTIALMKLRFEVLGNRVRPYCEALLGWALMFAILFFLSKYCLHALAYLSDWAMVQFAELVHWLSSFAVVKIIIVLAQVAGMALWVLYKLVLLTFQMGLALLALVTQPFWDANFVCNVSEGAGEVYGVADGDVCKVLSATVIGISAVMSVVLSPTAFYALCAGLVVHSKLKK